MLFSKFVVEVHGSGRGLFHGLRALRVNTPPPLSPASKALNQTKLPIRMYLLTQRENRYTRSSIHSAREEAVSPFVSPTRIHKALFRSHHLTPAVESTSLHYRRRQVKTSIAGRKRSIRIRSRRCTFRPQKGQQTWRNSFEFVYIYSRPKACLSLGAPLPSLPRDDGVK